MNRICAGCFGGGELEPGVFHLSLVDTPLLPSRRVRVEDEPDPANPSVPPDRVLTVDTEGLDH